MARMKELEVALTAAARSAIVSSFVTALSANESTGSLVTQVCETAQRYMKGNEIPADDRAAITADIAKARGWKGASAKARISECNIVLRAYAELPEYSEAFKTRAKKCQWHDSLKLARRINAGDSMQKAVAFAMKSGSDKKGTPKGRITRALKTYYTASARSAKREAILRAAELMGIKLGVKLDA